MKFQGENYKLNNIQMLFINNDQYMSEEEKKAAFSFFQPSISYLIEEAPAITKLELKNVQPYPEQDFQDLFKLEHLPKRLKKLAIQILKNHKPVFSTHNQDIGKVNCIN